ncbi:MAG: zinc-dependent metalloprotease family protein [Gemmobacter sp.]
MSSIRTLIFTFGISLSLVGPLFAQSLISGEAVGDLTPELESALNQIRELPAVTDAQIVTIDASSLGNTNVMFDLAAIGGPVYAMVAEPRTAAFAEASLDRGDAFSWTADVSGDAFAMTIIEVDSNKRVYGSVLGSNRTYEIRPIAETAHVLIEYDTSSFPPEHPEELPTDPEQPFEDGSISPDLPDELPPIRILIAFTTLAAQPYPNPEIQARLIVSSANRVYEESRIPTRLELAGFELVDYTEGASMYADLDALRLKSDGEMDDLHSLRDKYEADLVHLIVSRTDFCGLAYVNAGKETAFGVTAAQCAVANLSFAHEIGHNLGACHDPLNSSNCTPYSPDGYGFQHPLGLYRDVMAYQCPNGPCARRPVLSHPKEYGESGKHNVRRMTHVRTSIVVGFR